MCVCVDVCLSGPDVHVVHVSDRLRRIWFGRFFFSPDMAERMTETIIPPPITHGATATATEASVDSAATRAGMITSPVNVPPTPTTETASAAALTRSAVQYAGCVSGTD